MDLAAIEQEHMQFIKAFRGRLLRHTEKLARLGKLAGKFLPVRSMLKIAFLNLTESNIQAEWVALELKLLETNNISVHTLTKMHETNQLKTDCLRLCSKSKKALTLQAIIEPCIAYVVTIALFTLSELPWTF